MALYGAPVHSTFVGQTPGSTIDKDLNSDGYINILDIARWGAPILGTACNGPNALGIAPFSQQ